MKKRLFVVYKNGMILSMPFCKMDYDKVMIRYPEIASIYEGFSVK